MLFVCLSDFDNNNLRLYERFNVVFEVNSTVLNVFDVNNDMRFFKLSELSFLNFRKLFNTDDAIILSLKINVFFSVSFSTDDETC